MDIFEICVNKRSKDINNYIWEENKFSNYFKNLQDDNKMIILYSLILIQINYNLRLFEKYFEDILKKSPSILSRNRAISLEDGFVELNLFVLDTNRSIDYEKIENKIENKLEEKEIIYLPFSKITKKFVDSNIKENTLHIPIEYFLESNDYIFRLTVSRINESIYFVSTIKILNESFNIEEISKTIYNLLLIDYSFDFLKSEYMLKNIIIVGHNNSSIISYYLSKKLLINYANIRLYIYEPLIISNYLNELFYSKIDYYIFSFNRNISIPCLLKKNIFWIENDYKDTRTCCINNFIKNKNNIKEYVHLFFKINDEN